MGRRKPSPTFEAWTASLRRCVTWEEMYLLLREFEAQDPRLHFRVLIDWDGGPLPGSTADMVRQARAAFGPELLWKIYTGEAPWGDPGGGRSNDRFRNWLLENAPAIYGDSDPGFLKLWEQGGREGTTLALVAAALNRDRSFEVLKAGLKRADSRQGVESFFRQLLRDHFP